MPPSSTDRVAITSVCPTSWVALEEMVRYEVQAERAPAGLAALLAWEQAGERAVG